MFFNFDTIVKKARLFVGDYIMTEPFKYMRLLRFAELSYHLNETGLFLTYYNGFLNQSNLEMPENMPTSFENCMSYLDSTSMVEKFLCAYFYYLENNDFRTNPVSGFSFYDQSELERLDNRSITMKFKLKTHNDISFRRMMSIKINKDGICYWSNPDDVGIFRIFKKPEHNKRYFINVKDVIYIHQQIYSQQEIEKVINEKEIKKIHSLIGKKIEYSYELPSYHSSGQ